MNFKLLLLLLAAVTTPAHAGEREISQSDLRGHIEILASDDFGGRAPGTIGENKTVNYIATQWSKAGLKPAANQKWYAPVFLVERSPITSLASIHWIGADKSKGKKISNDDIVLRGRVQTTDLSDLQIILDDYQAISAVELDSLVRGKAVFIPLDPPKGANEEYNIRKRALIAAGASAVITVTGGNEKEWKRAQRRFVSVRTNLSGPDEHAVLEGIIRQNAFRNLLSRVGEQKSEVSGAALPLYFNASVETNIREYKSHNVVAKIEGKRLESGAILFLGHWDHFGECRSKENNANDDIICNGAVDNASGISLLIELAKRLAQTKLDRDIYFLATTAEEKGLLGAHAFAAAPPIPLAEFAAIFNVDTVAIAPDGKKIAIVGYGKTNLDVHLDRVAKEQSREIGNIKSANRFLKRQDGYVFLEKSIPAVLVSSAFSDTERLEAFLSGRYHDVTDEAGKELILGGAADDANFHVALGKYFGNTATYPQIAPSDKAPN